MRSRRRWLVGVFACAFVLAGGATAAAADEVGIDPNQGESLAEVNLPNKGAAMRLQLEADKYGVDFNEHYLRQEADGSVTVTVFGTDGELAALDAAGFEVGVTIEGQRTWRNRIEARQLDVRKENRAEDAAQGDAVITPRTHEDELVILRADYFENYAGRFLSVEAKTRLATVDPEEGEYTGPTLSLSWNGGVGTPISSTPRPMNVNVDPDTEPNTYIEHRELVRIGDVGTFTPRRPNRIRIGSSTGATIEGDVQTWLGGGLPPMNDLFIRDFTTRYLDPTEVYDRFDALAAEFPNIAQQIPLPYKTNGYQRKSQALMSGARGAGRVDPEQHARRTARADAGRGPHGARVGP